MKVFTKKPAVAFPFLLSLLAASGCGTDGAEPMYLACETDDDCSSATPVCGTFEVAGAPARWCTTECSDSSECPSQSWQYPIVGLCLSFDAEGRVDPGGSERRCALECGICGARAECVALDEFESICVYR